MEIKWPRTKAGATAMVPCPSGLISTFISAVLLLYRIISVSFCIHNFKGKKTSIRYISLKNINIYMQDIEIIIIK